jgi:hypothetical protein
MSRLATAYTPEYRIILELVLLLPDPGQLPAARRGAQPSPSPKPVATCPFFGKIVTQPRCAYSEMKANPSLRVVGGSAGHGEECFPKPIGLREVDLCEESRIEPNRSVRFR